MAGGFVFSCVDAEFKNTGLERSASLAKDLEWFKEQGYTIPEPSSPGLAYAHYLTDLSQNDPQAFICHFYNIYFAHSAGGRMIGKKVTICVYAKRDYIMLSITVFFWQMLVVSLSREGNSSGGA